MLVWTCSLKQSWGPFKRGAVSQKSTERKRTVLQGKSWPSSCFHLKKSCKCLERTGETQRGYVSVIIECIVLFTYLEFDFESILKIEVDFCWRTVKMNFFATKWKFSSKNGLGISITSFVVTSQRELLISIIKAVTSSGKNMATVWVHWDRRIVTWVSMFRRKYALKKLSRLPDWLMCQAS